MRDKYFRDHAKNTIERIREFREQSPLGMFNSPAEYIETLEEFVKLFYGINEVPGHVLQYFDDAKHNFLKFKESVNVVCDAMQERLKEINNDNDTPKNKEAS